MKKIYISGKITDNIIVYIYFTAQKTRCRILPAELAAFRRCKKAAQQQKKNCCFFYIFFEKNH